WESPWGMGYPGWHIECSAMSRKYLGDHFDIHTGGIDHLTIHHENEIAQNDCSCGHKSVNYWIHSEFLLVDGGKMSKSLGNVYTVPELVSRGFKALDYRYFCLNTHYHNKLNFTFAGLDSAKIGYERLRNLVLLHKTGENKVNAETLEKYHALFLDAINDDLNLPKALGIVWEMLKTEEKSEDIYNLTVEFDSVFGLDLDKAEVENQKQEIPQIVVELANQRLLARKNKDFALSDKLREELKQNGYAVKDNALGYELTKI
ncbi:MAG: cysteine--tRNA ligase, partial [Clostridia bacterium]|nr:cysteine--tRNA ligase [Clostridia bacterium]